MGGIYAHSLAVLTDAAHMLSDVLAFAISLGAGTYALRASKGSHTFGYHRAEVLGSMVSRSVTMPVINSMLSIEAEALGNAEATATVVCMTSSNLKLCFFNFPSCWSLLVQALLQDCGDICVSVQVDV